MNTDRGEGLQLINWYAYDIIFNTKISQWKRLNYNETKYNYAVSDWVCPQFYADIILLLIFTAVCLSVCFSYHMYVLLWVSVCVHSLILLNTSWIGFTGFQSASGSTLKSLLWPTILPSWVISPYQPSRSLRSSNQLLLTASLSISQHAFSHSSPVIAIALSVSDAPSIGTFKHCLKSVYFNSLFNKPPPPSDCPHFWFKRCLTVESVINLCTYVCLCVFSIVENRNSDAAVFFYRQFWTCIKVCARFDHSSASTLLILTSHWRLDRSQPHTSPQSLSHASLLLFYFFSITHGSKGTRRRR